VNYGEIIKKTAEIFKKDFKLPVDERWQKDIDTERWLSIKAVKVYRYRIWQLEKMGFVALDPEELIRVLYGNKHNFRQPSSKGVRYEYVYNHLRMRQESKKWLFKSEKYSRYERQGLFHWPPYKKKLIWSCNFCNLPELKDDIPPGAMLKILRCKALKTFNSFHAIDPIEPKACPVFIGSVWELPPNFENNSTTYNKAGATSHFFLSE